MSSGAPAPVAAGPELVVQIEAVEVDRDSSLAELVQAGLHNALAGFAAHVPVVWADEDPEGVHQTRVSLRRARSLLRAFAPVLDDEWRRRLDGQLAHRARVLGVVRDLDVLSMRLESSIERMTATDDRDAGQLLLAQLHEQRSAPFAEVASELAPDVLDPFLTAVLAEVDGLQLRSGTAANVPARDVATVFVARPWWRMRRAATRLPKGLAAPVPELHALRIKAKRVRYACDAVRPVLGKPPKRLSKAVADLQDVLGDLHDTAVAETWLRRAATTSGLAADSVLVAGRLIEAQVRQADVLHASWGEAWASVRRVDTSWIPRRGEARDELARLVAPA